MLRPLKTIKLSQLVKDGLTSTQPPSLLLPPVPPQFAMLKFNLSLSNPTVKSQTGQAPWSQPSLVKSMLNPPVLTLWPLLPLLIARPLLQSSLKPSLLLHLTLAPSPGLSVFQLRLPTPLVTTWVLCLLSMEPIRLILKMLILNALFGHLLATLRLSISLRLAKKILLTT